MSKESKQEQKEAIQEKFEEYYKTRDKKLRDELIEEHMYIVDILSNKYVGKGIEKDDLYQVASLGLIYAIDRFDPTKGYAFSSFATPTIMGELKRYFRDKGWVIRVPRRIQNLYKKINTAKKILPQELQRTPTVADIADYLGEDEETILETMEASKVYAPQSLDMKYQVQKGENAIDLSEMIGEEDKNFDSIELKDLIDKSKERLNDLEKEILELRYYEGRTQVDIANTLDISQMTVSRIEKKIIQKFTLELEKMK
ncbi:SigB/SigF/SigG family RNA polymerase sigma factor [Anaerococcus prevotii]|uniref:Putative RNA polymerase sigma-F factor n=1 Tax=Anaerococcus prevotii ACS-065-V-Col13 TaxID=879305 RepID=F0GW27_9FIRM|nr:SigB/SigF/SigG family RNA polymerase sigma factor [Anaerococcus prevotii]EGC81925.1 putative RNA polymerase sigma-F factor [Anaerococcus prevotii ACS-065-V-Col13]MDU5148900.1 SigB/SigF/SigG family RNA polymerase sigma factor [Anaerococcus prevotii]